MKFLVLGAFGIILPFVLCQDPPCMSTQEISVNYEILYPDAQCSTATPPDAVNGAVNANSSVLRLMERVADLNTAYRFTATYFGSTLGYFIDTINGTQSNNPCFWFIYIRLPTGEEFLSPLGVSNYIISALGHSIIWRYETFDANSTEHNTTAADPADGNVGCVDPVVQQIGVNYEIQFPIENCTSNMINIVPPTPVLVNIVNGSSALAVLEGAVDIDPGYRFTATYFGSPLGYLIEAINGTASEFPCFWFFYIQEPGGQPEFSQVGVSNYVVPDSGYSVIFRYEIFDETEPGHSPNGAKSYLPTVTNLLLLGCIAVIFNYI